jgi:DNA segregation ATPase FtsK/SpoIIIE-like protein
MRTNTWLGLIALNQMTQVLQADNIARAQKARDDERDAAFAKAQEAAQQGQFAMWIQTPDGQRFERWSHHALEASRAIDDRQIAWDLAWEHDLQKRREEARPAALAEIEASLPGVPEERTRRAQRQGLVGFLVTVITVVTMLGSGWFANVSPEHEFSATLVALIALLLTIPALGFTIWRFWVGEEENRRAKAIPHHVDELIARQVISDTFSWHRTSSPQRLKEVQWEISELVENASAKYPRKDDLVQLARTYDARTVATDDANTPATIRRLLEGFQEEDRERKTALHRDGVA